jgi:hypothetical protein
VPDGPRPDPPARSAKVEFVGTYGEAPWVNVMWLRLLGSGDFDNGILHNEANLLFDQYALHFVPLLNVQAELEFARLSAWDSAGIKQQQSNRPPVQGGKIQESLPASVAACVSWPIGVHYRGGHPRSYLVGGNVVEMDTTRTWVPAFVSAASAAADAFHTGVESTAPGGDITFVEHGVMSFVRKKLWREPPVFYRIALGARVDSRIDTQRRRLGPDVP